MVGADTILKTSNRLDLPAPFILPCEAGDAAVAEVSGERNMIKSETYLDRIASLFFN